MQSQKAFDMPVQEYHESFWGPCVQLYHMIESHLSNRNSSVIRCEQEYITC